MTPPRPGQIYTSAKNPEIAFFVETVHANDKDGFFVVEACHPSAISDMTAPGFDLTNDEWEALLTRHDLRPSTD